MLHLRHEQTVVLSSMGHHPFAGVPGLGGVIAEQIHNIINNRHVFFYLNLIIFYKMGYDVFFFINGALELPYIGFALIRQRQGIYQCPQGKGIRFFFIPGK